MQYRKVYSNRVVIIVFAKGTNTDVVMVKRGGFQMIRKNDFAARIKQYCTQRGLSVSELEKSVGYSAGMISRWSGTNEDFGILTKLVAMADFLDLSLDELVGREEKANAPPANAGTKLQRSLQFLIDQTNTQRLVWEWFSCEDGQSSVFGTIPDIPGGIDCAGAFWCQCEDIYFVLVRYCDNLEDMNEEMVLALYCTVGHGFSLVQVQEDAAQLHTLYLFLRMGQIMA